MEHYINIIPKVYSIVFDNLTKMLCCLICDKDYNIYSDRKVRFYEI